jgi:hypothetical protein
MGATDRAAFCASAMFESLVCSAWSIFGMSQLNEGRLWRNHPGDQATTAPVRALSHCRTRVMIIRAAPRSSGSRTRLGEHRTPPDDQPLRLLRLVLNRVRWRWSPDATAVRGLGRVPRSRPGPDLHMVQGGRPHVAPVHSPVRSVPAPTSGSRRDGHDGRLPAPHRRGPRTNCGPKGSAKEKFLSRTYVRV